MSVSVRMVLRKTCNQHQHWSFIVKCWKRKGAWDDTGDVISHRCVIQKSNTDKNKSENLQNACSFWEYCILQVDVKRKGIFARKIQCPLCGLSRGYKWWLLSPWHSVSTRYLGVEAFYFMLMLINLSPDGIRLIWRKQIVASMRREEQKKGRRKQRKKRSKKKRREKWPVSPARKSSGQNGRLHFFLLTRRNIL